MTSMATIGIGDPLPAEHLDRQVDDDQTMKQGRSRRLRWSGSRTRRVGSDPNRTTSVVAPCTDDAVGVAMSILEARSHASGNGFSLRRLGSFLQLSKGGSVSARTVKYTGSRAPIAIMLALLLFVSVSAAGQRSDPATRPPEPAGAQDRPGRRHPAFYEHRRPSRTPTPDKTDAPVPPDEAGAAPRPSP